MSVTNLLAELGTLEPDALQKVRAQAELLLDSGSGKAMPQQNREMRRVHVSISAALFSHGIQCPPFHVLRATSLNDLRLATRSLKQLAEEAEVAIGYVTQLCVRLAVDFLQEKRKTVRFRTLCSQLEEAPALLDRAFPAYSMQALQLLKKRAPKLVIEK